MCTPWHENDHNIMSPKLKAQFQVVTHMKRTQFVRAFVLVGLILLLPIGLQQSASAAGRLLPRISFKKTVCDLGDVGQGTRNSCEFKFTNTGRGLLKIGKISRTCGCTVFKLDKKEYAPGEAGTIKGIKGVRLHPQVVHFFPVP